jgi:hypothetical protein
MYICIYGQEYCDGKFFRFSRRMINPARLDCKVETLHLSCQNVIIRMWAHCLHKYSSFTTSVSFSKIEHYFLSNRDRICEILRKPRDKPLRYIQHQRELERRNQKKGLQKCRSFFQPTPPRPWWFAMWRQTSWPWVCHSRGSDTCNLADEVHWVSDPCGVKRISPRRSKEWREYHIPPNHHTDPWTQQSSSRPAPSPYSHQSA